MSDAFVLFAVQPNGDKVRLEAFPTLAEAEEAAVAVARPSIERVTPLGSTVVFDAPALPSEPAVEADPA
jgi:hypothetical protein